MRVLLRPDVFTSSFLIELYVLLWLGSVGRHRVIPDPLDQPEHAVWLGKLDEQTRRLWTDMVDGSLQREILEPAHWEVVVTTTNYAAWALPTPSLPIGVAVDMLLQPYRILLENNINDRAFLLALCGQEERRALLDAEQRAWLVFEMGGGSTIVPRVEDIRRSEAMRRMVSVLIDSDAMRPKKEDERPEDVEGSQAYQVRRAAGDALTGVHIRVLRRRSIENYLPAAALRRWARGHDERRRRIEALERLTEPQRHYYNMKSGFDGDTKNAERAGSLYQELPPRVRERLRQGFGYDIAKLFARSVKIEDVETAARDEVRAFVADVLARMR